MKEIKAFFKGCKNGITNFGHTISTLVNSVLLTIVYFVGVGITAIFAKLLGKHFLQRRLLRKRKSYWCNLNLKKRPLEQYYRQF